jgi:hypothetical protein
MENETILAQVIDIPKTPTLRRVLGFLVCFSIWISLPIPAKIIGGIWLLTGLIYLSIRTRGFTQKPLMMDFKDV